MRKIAIGTGLMALVLAAGMAPASAEFFGCNDQHSSRTISYRAYHRAPSYGAARYTHEFAAQSRPRISHSRVTYVGSPRYWHERSRW
jgi:hypothetical protein